MKLAPGHAVDFLIETLMREEAGSVTLVPIGPLTNIAMALIREPAIAPRIRRIVMMGGGFFEGGNTTPAAEFNVYADPEAAAVVLAAGCPVRMCGLDLTHQVTAGPDEVARLRTVGGPAATLVADVIDHELAAWGRYASASPLPPLHDPVALLAVTHPHLVSGTVTPIHVELAGHRTRGATVVDRRLVTVEGARPSEVGATTEWVHTVDAPAMVDAIVDACRRWA